MKRKYSVEEKIAWYQQKIVDLRASVEDARSERVKYQMVISRLEALEENIADLSDRIRELAR